MGCRGAVCSMALLGAMGAMAEPLENLVESLRQPDVERRRSAAEQLARLGQDAREACLPLVRALADSDETVREHAAAALEDLGLPRDQHRQELEDLLGSRNDDVAYWSATLLGRLQSPASAPALATALRNSQSLAVKERIVWAIGRIGAHDPDVIKSLQALTGGSHPRLARLAAEALNRPADR